MRALPTAPSTRLLAAALALLTLAALAADPSDAYANGFTIPDNGTKSVGRGGGYMLGATGPEVIYYNPALLTRLKGFHLTLDVNLLNLDATFQRSGTYPTPPEGTPEGQSVPYPSVSNTYEGPLGVGLFPAPMIFLSHDFGLKDFTFGLAAYGPSAVGSRSFGLDANTPGDGLSPSRYILSESTILQIFYTAAVAWQWRGLRLGASLQLAHLMPEFTLAVHGENLTRPDKEDPTKQAIVNIDTEGFAPTGILGVAYDVSPALSFGLAFQKGADYTTTGTAQVEFSPELVEQVNPRLTDDGVTFKVSDADILRLGARYAYIDGGKERFDVELVGTWERWSRNKRFDIALDGDVELQKFNNLAVELKPIAQDKKWEDAFSVRLGGDVPVLDWLTLRTGAFYETAAIPEDYTHLDFFSMDRFGAGLGATFHLDHFDIDAGYLHVFEAERDVTDGKVLMEAPLTAFDRPVVNNGRYNVSYDIFSLGVTWRFGEAADAFTPAVNDLDDDPTTQPEAAP